MAKQPKTTSEHLISIYGLYNRIEKREYLTIKNNHLKHLHQDVDRITWTKVDKYYMQYWVV